MNNCLLGNVEVEAAAFDASDLIAFDVEVLNLGPDEGVPTHLGYIVRLEIQRF